MLFQFLFQFVRNSFSNSVFTEETVNKVSDPFTGSYNFFGSTYCSRLWIAVFSQF